MKILPPSTIPRDISWLSFNARVLQEAADPGVPLQERIKFLGIFSNNLDEFFRVRVAALRRMIRFGDKARMHQEESPQRILDAIQEIVLEQQQEFSRVWEEILEENKAYGNETRRRAEYKKKNLYIPTEPVAEPVIVQVDPCGDPTIFTILFDDSEG